MVGKGREESQFRGSAGSEPGDVDEFAAIERLQAPIRGRGPVRLPDGPLPPPGDMWIGDDAAVVAVDLGRPGPGHRPRRRGGPFRSRPRAPSSDVGVQGGDGRGLRPGRHGGLAALRPGVDRRPAGDRPRAAGRRAGRGGVGRRVRGRRRRPVGVPGPGGVGGGHAATLRADPGRGPLLRSGARPGDACSSPVRWAVGRRPAPPPRPGIAGRARPARRRRAGRGPPPARWPGSGEGEVARRGRGHRGHRRLRRPGRRPRASGRGSSGVGIALDTVPVADGATGGGPRRRRGLRAAAWPRDPIPMGPWSPGVRTGRRRAPTTGARSAGGRPSPRADARFEAPDRLARRSAGATGVYECSREQRSADSQDRRSRWIR